MRPACCGTLGIVVSPMSHHSPMIKMFSRSLQLVKILRMSPLCCRHKSTTPNAITIKQFEDSFSRNVKLKVCARFAQHPKYLRPWFLRYIPQGGHEMSIDYIDTKPDADPDTVKTIVILHGTPGSYYDFFKFLVTFGTNYRIIVPNFPNFSYTLQTGCFWHSAEEKSEYIADFLKQINVKNVDCLIAHSMATYTASYLWIYANWSDYFKLGSICLLSPIGIFKPGRRERIRLSFISNMCRSILLQPYIPKRFLVSKKGTKPLLGSISANFEITMWKTLTLYLSNYKNYHLRLRGLADSKIPTLFMFSSNDKLYNANIFYDQLFELRAHADDFDVYEQYHNELIQSCDDQSWLKVVDFRSAGHYMFNTHSTLIHSYIAELLDKSWTDYKQQEIEQEASAQ